MRKGQKVPRKATRGLREKAWWALRRHKSLTLVEMLSIVHDGNQKDPSSNLRKWLNKLHFAGLLKRELEHSKEDHPNSNGMFRYCLEKDLGPKAPILKMSDGIVLDPNSGCSHIINEPPRVKLGDL